MTNSISPLLTPIDVLAYQNSIITLSGSAGLNVDQVSDLFYFQGRIWFVWQQHAQAPEAGKKFGKPAKIGLATCKVCDDGKLDGLKFWPLPVPPSCMPATAPEFKIVTNCSGRLITLLTIDKSSIVFSFSPTAECWYLGVYGSATKRFRFHVIESVSDISTDKFQAATIASTVILYTHDGELYGGFDDSRYHNDDRLRTPEVSKLLDLSFFQKIKILLPTAAPFIFLNSPVAWDEQIKEPPGGKAIYLPSHEQRVVLIYNYEPLIKESDLALAAAEKLKLKFKWPGLVMKNDEFFDIVFAVTHDQSSADVKWSNAIVAFRLPLSVVDQAAMAHKCEQDTFSCVAGFCKLLA